MHRLASNSALLFSILLLLGCQSAYYSAMEKVGVHKREILVDRVQQAKDAQQQAQQQFQSAFAQLSELIGFDGEKLEAQYQTTQDQYEISDKAAQRVSSRIVAVENVANALFDEWSEEITHYSSESLKRQSELKLRQTQRRYQQLLQAMHKAEARMLPVLAALKDNALFLKHNLNAQAIGALQGEYVNLKKEIEQLVEDMNSAIEQAQQFIEAMENS
jgi:hypothetical protein